MLGALAGDVIGSVFEFDRGPWTKNFTLFTRESAFTDDSVMTVAVADALLRSGPEADEETVKKNLIMCMQRWGRTYPNAGYGARFIHWVFAEDPHPYNSLGNGSAMRVSSVGWLYHSIERTREAARWTAEVSHNHPEGIKGAECTASVIFLGRMGFGKNLIRGYVEREFDYDFHTTVKELRKYHHHEETCMDALPKALVSFFEGDSYEDVVRNAVSLGGDTDTIACIAGAMAEAYYGVPLNLKEEVMKRLPADMRDVLGTFEEIMGNSELLKKDPEERRNRFLEEAVMRFAENPHSNDRYIDILQEFARRYEDDGQVFSCMINHSGAMPELNPDNLKIGDTVTMPEMRLGLDVVKDNDGHVFMPVYTNSEESGKNTATNITMNMSLRFLVEETLRLEEPEGIVINPFGVSVILDRKFLARLKEHFG